MKRFIAIAVFAAAFAVPHAFAGEKGSFADIDTNSNGTLSLAEIRAAYRGVKPETFSTADVDANGELTQAEYDAWKTSKLMAEESKTAAPPKTDQ